MKTLIEGGWVVAFNGKGHEVYEQGSVVFEDDRIVHAGGAYTGAVDTVIVDGKILVQGGRSVQIDEDEVYAKAQQVTQNFWSHVPTWRSDGAGVDRIVPPAFPIRKAPAG